MHNNRVVCAKIASAQGILVDHSCLVLKERSQVCACAHTMRALFYIQPGRNREKGVGFKHNRSAFQKRCLYTTMKILPQYRAQIKEFIFHIGNSCHHPTRIWSHQIIMLTNIHIMNDFYNVFNVFPLRNGISSLEQHRVGGDVIISKLMHASVCVQAKIQIRY